MLLAGRAERFGDVRRIAVLRGGGLGDLMFAMPALEALRAAYPQADITLIGSPAHAALLAGRPGPVDEVVVPPPSPGVRPGDEDEAATGEFFARMRAIGLDLAVQVHGGGRNSNPFLLRLGARHTVGTRTPDAVALERTLAYTYYQHEVLRALEVVGLAGADPVVLEPRLAVTEAELARGRALAGRLRAGRRSLLVIHPGATDPRRRWPLDRVAALAAAAVGDGCGVALVGDAGDAAACERIAGTLGAAVTSTAGRLSLPDLLGLLACCDVFVGNDSGPRHLAQAVGAATVGLFWVGNVINAGPMTRARHRIEMSWTTRCPVCGTDVTQVGWTAQRCEHDPSFLVSIPVDAVLGDVRSLLAGEA